MSNSPNLKFLLDENVRIEVEKFLKSRKFPTEYPPKGTMNSEVGLLAKKKESVLLTRDSDFLNTVLFPPQEFFGIVVFRIHPPTAEKLVKALSSLLQEVKEFKGKLFIVREEGFEVIEG